MTELTGDWSELVLADGGQVAQEVASIEGLPRPTEPHENEGLVVLGHHHVTVGLLSHGKDVRGHVLPSAASEHLNYLVGGREGERGGESDKLYFPIHTGLFPYLGS